MSKKLKKKDLLALVKSSKNELSVIAAIIRQHKLDQEDLAMLHKGLLAVYGKLQEIG